MIISISVPEDTKNILEQVDEFICKDLNRSQITLEAWQLWLRDKKARVA